MPFAKVKYVDPAPLYDAQGNLQRHWSKVEGPFQSFGLLEREVFIENISGRESEFDIDRTGFAVHHWPLTQQQEEDIFATDERIRSAYYPEVERLLHERMPGTIQKVVIFDHTLRQMVHHAKRKPVMQVHVDQTAAAAEARVKRHVPVPEEAETLLRSRYVLVNVWRPIGSPAIEYPLATVDWRTLRPEDFVDVDLLYPVHAPDDNRGLEAIPPASSLASAEGYEVRGETYGIAPNENHKFYYVKDMTPDWAMVFKCADSKGSRLPEGDDDDHDDHDGSDTDGMVAGCCPHTAFVDPETPADAPSRRSIEVRCLVFFNEEES